MVMCKVETGTEAPNYINHIMKSRLVPTSMQSQFILAVNFLLDLAVKFRRHAEVRSNDLLWESKFEFWILLVKSDIPVFSGHTKVLQYALLKRGVAELCDDSMIPLKLWETIV